MKLINKQISVVVLNSDLEGLLYPVPTTGVHSVNSITFEIRNNCPFLQGQVSGIPTSFYMILGHPSPRLVRIYFRKPPIARKFLAVKRFHIPSELSVVKVCISKV